MTSKHLKLIQNSSENTSSNHILYGVAGTGKTYTVQQISFELLITNFKEDLYSRSLQNGEKLWFYLKTIKLQDLLALTMYLHEIQTLSKNPENIAQRFTVSELLLEQVISCYLTLNYKNRALLGLRG